MYFKKCAYCEANLDPGEHCDCLQSQASQPKLKQDSQVKESSNSVSGFNNPSDVFEYPWLTDIKRLRGRSKETNPLENKVKREPEQLKIF